MNKPLMMKVGLIVLMGLMIAAPVWAASVQMSRTTKTAFDKIAASANSSIASNLSSSYRDLIALEEQNKEWDRKATAIHNENANRLSEFSQQMKQLDANKRRKLEQEYRQTKKRYEPLFNTYSGLNKQISLARFFKSKEATAILRAQADAMKIPLELARKDIKAKLNAWNAAKSSTANTVKQVRQTIAETKPLQDQIKAKRKSITSLNGRFREVWKPFSSVVRKGDATATLNTLIHAVAISRQKIEQKESIYVLENRIRDILQPAP